MKIALQIPLRHWDDFIEFTDFDVALIQHIDNPDYVKFYTENVRRETWLNNGFNEDVSADVGWLIEAVNILQPTHVVTAETYDPDFNVSMVMGSVVKFKTEGLIQKIVAPWHGEKRHLQFLSQQCDIVGLPWRYFRQKYLVSEVGVDMYDYDRIYEPKWNNSKNFHYFGFRNLDELRRFPPRSIDTDIPIVAAMQGIDLRDRVRRPKNMPKYDMDLKLSKAQVRLAIENIKTMKEAGNET